MLTKDYERIKQKYGRQVQAVETYMEKLAAAEKAGEENIDVIAGLTGEMVGEIFDWREDEWSEELRCLSFYLGKYVYLMDAYEDIEDDLKNHNYNPLKQLYKKPEFEDIIHKILTMMMAECSKTFEQLPLIDDIDILRNVLYSGVWYRYEQVREKREKEKEENNV